MYWSCSIVQSTYPSLIHPTAIIFSGAHLYHRLSVNIVVSEEKSRPESILFTICSSYIPRLMDICFCGLAQWTGSVD